MTNAKQVHHPDCGDVGATGEHGDLGTNAINRPSRAASAAPAPAVAAAAPAAPFSPEADIAASLVKAGYSPDEATKMAASAVEEASRRQKGPS